MNKPITSCQITATAHGGTYALKNTIDKNRSGMILVFVIVIMMLTALMGIIIMASTRTNLTTVDFQKNGDEAFNSADSAAKLSVLFSRVILHPVLGSPEQLIPASPSSPNNPMTIVLNEDRFKLDDLIANSDPFAYVDRYLETGMTKSPTAEDPHIYYKIGDKVVATAVISFGLESTDNLGFSLQTNDRYDQTSGPTQPVDMVITVKGNNSNTIETNSLIQPQSIITIILRELM
jgi:hypothetical protein